MIVSNTSTTEKEVATYQQIAKELTFVSGLKWTRVTVSNLMHKWKFVHFTQLVRDGLRFNRAPCTWAVRNMACTFGTSMKLFDEIKPLEFLGA